MFLMFLVTLQVGTQDISPLRWAIESGSLSAAKAIIEDLLTIRADRERSLDSIHDILPMLNKLCNVFDLRAIFSSDASWLVFRCIKTYQDTTMAWMICL